MARKMKIDGVWTREHPLYPAWCSMIARCEQPLVPSFKHYGGRGIRVCDRWRDFFRFFVADMGPKPTPQHSLDRIDVNGNYEPSNCRWADATTQSRNRRVVKPITVNGVTYPTQSAAAVAHGISKGDFSRRLRQGMTPEDAVQKRETIMVSGREYPSIKAAARAHGLPYKTVYLRLRTGWNTDKAFTSPIWSHRYAPRD